LKLRAWLALGIALLLWSSAYAGIRAGLRGYSPGQLAVFRFAVASTALALYATFKPFRRPARRDLPGLIFTGAVGISFYTLALNYGETTVSAGAGSMIVASTPVWTALLAGLFLHERLPLAGWLGVLVSFLGVVLIALQEDGGNQSGFQLSTQALAVCAAAVASGADIVLEKHFLRRYTALEVAAYTIWAGTILLLPFGGGLLDRLSSAPLGATLSAVYLGVFPGAVAYVAYACFLSAASASSTASFLYLTPVLAMLIAWAWLGEIPQALSLLGGGITLAGVLLVHRHSLRQAASAEGDPG
jgi:drug/metabolite transporter (DMT)-like permease